MGRGKEFYSTMLAVVRLEIIFNYLFLSLYIF